MDGEDEEGEAEEGTCVRAASSLPTRVAGLRRSETGSRFGAVVPRHIIAYDVASFVGDVLTLAALSETDIEIRQMMVATERGVPIWAGALRGVQYQQGDACYVFALTPQRIKDSCRMVKFERLRRKGYSWKYTSVGGRLSLARRSRVPRDTAVTRFTGMMEQTCFMQPSRQGRRRTTTFMGSRCCLSRTTSAMSVQCAERSSPV